ncbi:hypothetical protein TNCV_2210581 [Trichonephila clavipes]|nr:hypothetical protein TNCV_2210581 [Trichonephila clavipes]
MRKLVSFLEVRAMIRYLRAKNVSASAMSRKHAATLCHSYQSGRQDGESRNMTERGRQSSLMTEIATARIGEMIQNYRRG